MNRAAGSDLPTARLFAEAQRNILFNSPPE
jgi:hypothetical protein